ncbi:MAG: LytTR family DNA-binding domain-containing protein [Spirochaetia bacterium]|nr:LytTR family DNA-binding domain-containing protein [Spirochaetia bacterium]
MRILIIEDEMVAARGIEKMLRDLIGDKIESLKIQSSLTSSEFFLLDYPVDLLFLDLNLNGEDGFEILKTAAAGSFQTIIISANTDRAIEAFQYGVIDFVAKPIQKERFKQALDRFSNVMSYPEPLKYLSVKKDDRVLLVHIEEILYLEAFDNYVKIHMKNGNTEQHRKTLHSLEAILPDHFIRIHKSYILDFREVSNYIIRPGSKYFVELKNQTILPLSRIKYKELKDRL